MMMTSRVRTTLACFAAGAALSFPALSHAQALPYGDVSQIGGDTGEGDSAPDADSPISGGSSLRSKRASIAPYIEAQQVVLSAITPGDEVMTYTALAAGVDATITGRNTQGAMSLRYERRFGHGKNAIDSDVLSGIARASMAITPRALSLEAGAMATRMNVEGGGALIGGQDAGSSFQIYGIYVGPSLDTRLGEVQVIGHYRFGYNRVESPGAMVPGQGQGGMFDEGTVHSAQVHAGFQPGTLLPVGLGVGAGWNREDMSNLDQRIDDRHVRADVTIPLDPSLSLLGGIGYEDVSVAHRDAVRDITTGLPVIGSDGRYVTDESQPRRIAYEADGLIWDAGLLWRPSKRTALEAHVGRRYGSTSYSGSFAYAPSAQSSLNVSVYDNVTGFGGMLNNQLAALPTGFEGVRNPLTGDLGACVASGTSAGVGRGGCLGGALSSISGASFRSRGAMASIGITGRILQYGMGLGYDQRRFMAATGTVLGAADGMVEESLWTSIYLNARIDRASTVGTRVWANWHRSGSGPDGEVSALGATAAYYRTLTSRLSASAALGVEGVNRELLEDSWSAQAMVGVRYTF